MRKIDLRLRLFISFVILAILVMTLVPMPSMMPMLRPATSTAAMPAMPAMSMAPAAQPAMPELCSASANPQSSRLNHDGGQHTPADCDGMPMHCMFCSSAVHPVTPTISAAVLVLLLSFGSAYLPALFEHGPRTLFVWAPSQARAPPALLHG